MACEVCHRCRSCGRPILGEPGDCATCISWLVGVYAWRHRRRTRFLFGDRLRSRSGGQAGGLS